MHHYLKNKKILITGASGFIGTNLILKLVGLGAKLTCVIHKKKLKIDVKNIKIINADLTDKNDCIKVCHDIDIVLMCAANSSGAEVIEKKPLTHLTPNLVMNALMLEASYIQGVNKFVFISSNTVYPVTNFPVTEDDVNYTFFEKYHIVGWMKLFSEEMCRMYSRHIKSPMKTLVIRPGNIYGPYDKYNKNESKVIAALIRRFSEKQNPLEVWGDGNDIKDFIFIDDFVEGLINSIADDKIEGPINISSGEQVTIRDVIDCLKKISCSENTVINYDASKPSMIPIRLMSNNLAKKQINFTCKYSLYEGLKKTYEWYDLFYKRKIPEDIE